jgi:hypothetical protein
MNEGIHTFSLVAIRCLSRPDFFELTARVERMAATHEASILEPFVAASTSFTRLADVSGLGRFEVPLQDRRRITGMCSRSLPVDLLVTEKIDLRCAPAAIDEHVRNLCRDLQELQLVDNYDLIVLSATPENGASPADQSVLGATNEGHVASLCDDAAVIRFALPIGELLLLLARTPEEASVIQTRAIELGRLRGGCRDLIVRIRGHRDREFAPFIAELVGERATSHGRRQAEQLDDLVEQRQRLFDFDQSLTSLDHDRECLVEYVADVDATFASSALSARLLKPVRDALTTEEVAPIERIFQELRARYASTAAYLRDKIELAFAQTNLRMSRDVRLMQAVQIALAAAVLALALVQIFDRSSGNSRSRSGGTPASTTVRMTGNVTAPPGHHRGSTARPPVKRR